MVYEKNIGLTKKGVVKRKKIHETYRKQVAK